MGRHITQGHRGADIIAAALTCGRRFGYDEFYPAFLRQCTERGTLNPGDWKANARQGLQRVWGESSIFQDEGRTFNLITSPRRGVFHIRDEYYQRLVDGMNEQIGGIMLDPTAGLLIRATEADIPDTIGAYRLTPNEIGAYAQRKIMAHCESAKGWKVLRDTGATRAFDFTFLMPGRVGLPRVCECKGTVHSPGAGSVQISANEIEALLTAYPRGVLAIVFNIREQGGRAIAGSEPYYVDPFTLAARSEIQLMTTVRVRLNRQPGLDLV